MVPSGSTTGRRRVRYKLVPPEGGWGHVVMLSMAVMCIVTAGPTAAFGIIYGKYLATISDEASATALVNSTFNTVSSFMGLVANKLLKKHSCRFVGILGSISFFTGNFLTTFTSSLWQIICTFGVLQGIGFGLMLSAVFASFNEYFSRRKTLMMAVSRALVAALTMLTPYFARMLMDEYGYRGTVLLLSAVSLHALVGMVTLQPAARHMKKVLVSSEEIYISPSEHLKLNKMYTGNNEKNCDNLSEVPIVEETKNASCINKLWNTISSFLELSLLKDSSYVNLAIGVSLSFTSDMMFLSLLPMFLSHLNYTKNEIANLMTIYMAADLIGRILLSLVSAAVKIKNKILFLCATTITAVARAVFTLNSGQRTQTLILIVVLGVLRCVVQVSVPLVLAEYDRSKFSASFGLYLAIGGIISITSGQLASVITLNTVGDEWIQHLLTFQLLVCVFSWIVEILYRKLRK